MEILYTEPNESILDKIASAVEEAIELNRHIEKIILEPEEMRQLVNELNESMGFAVIPYKNTEIQIDGLTITTEREPVH